MKASAFIIRVIPILSSLIIAAAISGSAQGTIFAEDFESVTAPALPPGWTTENPNGGFVFMTGDSAAANSGGFWAIDPHTQFAFASDDACNCNMSEVRLILPPLDLTNFVSVTLNAEVWLDNVYGSAPFETARIEVSLNGGASWTPVGSNFSPIEEWQAISIDLSDYDGSPNILIAFRYNDNGNWGRGLAVDDVEVEGFIPPPSTCLFSENFQGVVAPALPAGWTTENPNGGFVFMTGDSAAANSGGFWAIDPHGQFAFASDDACNCDMSEVRLILPPQDFTGASSVTLEAEIWLDNVYGSDPFETGRIEVSVDNGTSWVPAGPDFSPIEEWQAISVDLSAYDGMSNVWIAFRYDDNGNWGRGLAVDDLCIQGVTGPSICFFEEDFQSVTAPALPAGWTTENPNGGFVFVTGDSAAANSGGFWAIDPHGQFAFASDDACNCDMSEVRLILPAQDLTNYTSVSLSADVWLDNVYGSDPFETARVEVSTDNGVTWLPAGPDFPPVEAWQSINVDLSAYDGQTNVLIAFRYDDNGNWGRGLAVDDVCLQGVTEVVCVYSENFEAVTAPALPGGMTTENPNGGFVFMTGDSAAANSGGFWAIDPHGQFAFASDDACNCDMSEVRLILPPQDLTNVLSTSISAQVWLDNVYGSDPFETARIEVSIDNGMSWTPVGADFPPVEAWQAINIDLSAYDGMSNVWIAFRYDDNGNWGRGLAVDDICVSGFTNLDCSITEGFEAVTAPALPAGWTSTNPSGGFLFVTGDSAAANSGGFWAIDPHGQFAFASDDACNCDMSEVRLIMPVQDFSALTSIQLTAQVWLDNVYGSDPFETARVEISLDSGAFWTPVGPDFPPVEAWQGISRDLSPYAGQSNVLVAFRYDDNGNWGRGLAVDDVMLCSPVPDTCSVTIMCPADVADIECPSGFNTAPVGPNTPQDPVIDPMVTGTPSVSDSTQIESIDYQDQLLGPTAENCPDVWIVERTWTASNTCGSDTMCVQTFTFTDTTPPELTAPSDTLIDCHSPLATPSLYTQGLDERLTVNYPPGIAGTYETSTASFGPPLADPITADIVLVDDGAGVVTDACEPLTPASAAAVNGNIALIDRGQCFFTDKVFNAQQAGAVAAIIINNQPGPPIPMGSGSMPGVTIPSVMISMSDGDAIKNELLTGPVNGTLAGVLFVTVSDNCDPDVEVTVTDTQVPGSCPYNYTINRTWTAMDTCGNTTSVVQTLTVQDTTPPVIFSSVMDTVIDCNSPLVTPMLYSQGIEERLTVNSPPAVSGQYETSIASFGPPLIDPITADIVLVDDGVAVITDACEPLTAPSAAAVNGNIALIDRGQCFFTDKVFQAQLAGAVAAIIVNNVPGDPIPMGAGSMPGVTIPSVMISMAHGDAIKAALLTGPVNGTLQGFAFATAFDNCDTNVTVTVSDEIVPGNCPGNYTINRSFSAEDTCGNAASVVQVLTVQDTTAPFIQCPADTTVECGSASDTMTTGSPLVFDNCGIESVTFVDSDSIATGDGCAPFTFTRTWTATDSCGNSASCEQMITLIDTLPPTAVVPPDVTIECDEDIAAVLAEEPVFTDNCDPDVPAVGSIEFVQDPDCPQAGTYILAWTGTDECGNSTTVGRTVTVQDMTPPTANCRNVTVELDEMGTGTVVTADIDDGSSDNCGMVTLTDINESYNCNDIGEEVFVLTVTDECGNSSTCTAAVSIVDVTPPTIMCPSDIVVDLGPGECDAAVSWTISAFDNCAQMLTTGFLGTTFLDGNGFAGNMFDLTNIGSTQITLTSFDIHLSSLVGSEHIVEVYHTTDPQSFSVNPTGGAAGMSNDVWTFLGSAIVTSAGPGNPSALNVGGLMIPAGDTYGIYIYQTDGNDIDYTNGNLSVNDGSLQFDGGIGWGGNSAPAFTGPTFSPRYWNGNVHYDLQTFGPGVTDLEQTQGPPSGSFFEGGTSTGIEFVATDFSGNSAVCNFNVIVNDFTGYTTTLACNDGINVSVDENCSTVIGADMILEGGPYRCYDDYLVEVEGFGSAFGGVEITTDYFGIPLSVTVTDPETGVSCWGTITLEDKLPPQLTCMDVTLLCGESTDPVFSAPVSGALVATANPASGVGPDAGTVTESVLFVSAPEGARVTDLNFYLNLTHSFVGDLTITLTSPTGNSIVVLWDQNCTNQPTGFDITFDDESANSPFTFLCADLDDGLDVQLNGITPSFLSDVDGDNARGTWHLEVVDNNNGNGGVLNQWSLIMEYDVVAAYAPAVVENCEGVTLTYQDEHVGDECTGDGAIQRTWTATDASGNVGTCVQNILIQPLSIAGVQCPPSYTGECGDQTHPSITGWPTAGGIEIVDGNICNLFAAWQDLPVKSCGGSSKIIRTWIILDWCTQETIECVQVIKLTDNQGPVLDCPDNITVNADPWFCTADVNLDFPDAYDACGSSFDLSVSSSAGTIVSFGSYYRVDDLPLGTHSITWTATDACDNSSTCSYTITVEDNTPPVPLCDEHTIVALTNDDPLQEGLTKIPATVFDDGSYDACGPVTFLARRMASCIDFDWIGPPPVYGEYPNSDGIVTSLDRGQTPQLLVPFACCDVGAGPIMVELRVTDVNGNVNTCMVEVEVQDKIAPFLEAPPDIVVSCDFWFDVAATNGFVDPSQDVTTPIFGDVLDAYEFEPSDRQPIILNDPGNDEIPQPHQWGYDGWADDNCDVTITVRVRLFDDCSGEDLPGSPPSPYAVRLVERTWRARDASDNSTTRVQRIWVVDFDPYYISDQTCVNSDPNDGVIWPCDEEYTTCPEEIPVNYPTIFDDNCSLIGVTYEDTRFDFVDGACYKILREWTVIDWCQYDAKLGTGYWSHVQVIKVLDSDPADFADCPAGPVELCVTDDNVYLPDNNQVFLGEGNPNSSSCSAHVTMERTVHETCSDFVIYDVKLYPNAGSAFIQVVSKTEVDLDSNNNATLTFSSEFATLPSNHPIRRYGIPYNSPVCSNWPAAGGTKDYHRILWTVEDGCGNVSTCEYLFRLEDCKKPSPVCVGLSSVVMPSSGEVTIWAADFNASSFDDCTPAADLLYSFSGKNYEPSRTFDCEAIEANGSPSFIVEIWVADGGNDQDCDGFRQPLGIEWSERNRDFCTTFIVIDDNEGVCPGTGDVAGGVIETEELEAVESVTVNLVDQTGTMMQTYVTGDDGSYVFINPLLSYTIIPGRDDDHKNGVTTLDLVKIQKHLLGIEPLGTPYKLIAADANNSESVSAIDLVEIRKLILGVHNEFPHNESWRFVDAQFVFPDEDNPWPFDEVIELASGSTLAEDFVGVKVGDVNGTVAANVHSIDTRSPVGTLSLATPDQEIRPGDAITVPVSANNFESVLGYQFTLHTKGLELIGIEPGVLPVGDEHIGVFPNVLTTSWHSGTGMTALPGQVLFTLRFISNTEGLLSEILHISSGRTVAEAYATDAEDLLDVTLTFCDPCVEPAFENHEYALFQNVPNPFEQMTAIGFLLPERMDVQLTLFDVTGKTIREITGTFNAGYNEFEIQHSDLGASGMIYYRLDAGDFKATKKMIVVPRD